MLAQRIRRVAGDERLAAQVGFWWGLAEGTFFFIVPDVYITFAALFSVRAGAVAWLFSIAGSAVAICVIYLLTALLDLDYVRFLASIPGVSGALIERVGIELSVSGLPYTPLLVLGGVPLKVYGALAFSQGLTFGAVLMWTVFARFVRIAPTFAVASGLRALFHRRIDSHAITWCALLGIFWLLFYFFYFAVMSRA